MPHIAPPQREVSDELELLNELIPLNAQRIIELGCGAAKLAGNLVSRFPGCDWTGLDVDMVQHAANASTPTARMEFVAAGAQDIPFPDATFDLAIMLKSLHHVPIALLDTALNEAWRVLRPNGLLYVSEPVFAGALNEINRLFNDEEYVRAQAQNALDRALASGRWTTHAEVRFNIPVHFKDVDDYMRRMLDVTFAERSFEEAMRAQIRERFAPHMTASGANFARPMYVRVLRKTRCSA
ncbi:MAG TPA: class I SAM-dependent methyltransferase [Casimicrobium sp.]|nr:class I SAM-dependent methyltransferase [Casimicrobium sp.]